MLFRENAANTIRIAFARPKGFGKVDIFAAKSTPRIPPQQGGEPQKRCVFTIPIFDGISPFETSKNQTRRLCLISGGLTSLKNAKRRNSQNQHNLPLETSKNQTRRLYLISGKSWYLDLLESVEVVEVDETSKSSNSSIDLARRYARSD